MKKVWNKETRNEDGKYYRNDDWGVEVEDTFSKDNFTDVEPPEECMLSKNPAECDWVDGEWVKFETVEYARAKRSASYPPIGDQLDAIWKQLNQDRLNDKELIQEVDDTLGSILSVKASIPLPDITKEEK